MSRGDEEPPVRFVVGLDLGQARDPSALCVLQRVARPDPDAPEPDPATAPISPPTPLPGEPQELHARMLDRPPIGTPYTAIVDRIAQMMTRRPLAGQSALVIDGAGVGRPVLDLFRARGIRPLAVTSTAGNRVSGNNFGLSVPKRDLISALLLALEQGRLKFAAIVPHLDVLLDELADYRVHVTDSGRDTYEARAGAHDDMLFALALAVWHAERLSRRRATGVVTARTISAPRRPAPDRQWIEDMRREFLADKGPAERRRSFFIDW